MAFQEIDWQAEVEKRKEDLLTDLTTLLKIDSVRDDELVSEEAPVGPGPKEALEAFLNIAERDGFETESFGNIAGHIDYGEGTETLGVLAHVDVVPVGSGWETDPFDPVIKDGRIYARGASDDKGPGMAAYYAMRIIKDLSLPLSKKVRFIIGTDEESDWKCMDHYFSVNPQPDFGFSPDANFPIINGEKGNVTIYLDFEANSEEGTNRLVSFNSGLRENMVPQDAQAVVKVTGDVETIIAAFDKYVAENEISGEATVNENTVTFNMIGKASHGASPQNGVNAGTHLATFLDNFDLGGDGKFFVSTIANYLHNSPYGSRMGLNITDDVMGDLTMNIGVMHYSDEEAGRIAVNFRYPKNTDLETLQRAFEHTVSQRVKVSHGANKNPHYVSGDDPLVKTLLSVYERQTGLEGHEVVIGGGTYGRLLERGVAYGAAFPDSIDTMHQANEFMDLDDLFKATAIYAEAIYELAK